MEDVRVEERPVDQRLLLVDVEILRVLNEPGQCLASLLVSTMLEGDDVTHVDAAMSAHLVGRLAPNRSRADGQAMPPASVDPGR
jgi:hypothetical protein